ncbi:hypothetical protein K461DRAFT_279345 [Myriangium duriaei CBS 260.36]|uniref:Acyl-CoA dehydrogenase/oxidase C-terminal domain-containing protein n=1 Tax=Myriangium duriaei CBS 260.36 TaxID=1168546 RepID=A0A9P4J1P9_9PEZI|nr:hypothetical protein K461DRAFT_279345 [Myriangium duriaei CBS 260.36]
MANLTASSSTSGFFQALPVLPPQYADPDNADDVVLARILDIYIGSEATAVQKHLNHIARVALDPRVLVHSTDAETNHPTLRPLTTFGEENRNDPLWTTTGWQQLKEIQYKEGLVAVAYDSANVDVNRRVYEFALSHLFGPTGTMTSCPMSMTDGAATLLSRHLKDPDNDQVGRARVFQEAYQRLTSRDPAQAWTSGQWMTERTGGSDVSGTETVAHRLSQDEIDQDKESGRDVDAAGLPLGPWTINGFKWFSSATDSDVTVLLARTSKGGLSAFLIPMRRRLGTRAPTANIINAQSPPPSELNGIRIQRLKNKLGTKSLPTAELELKNARGWLIGTEGQGVKEISAILNITRLHTGAGSAAGWARGLAVCRAYSKVRKVRGGLLADNPAHLRWMADETVKYWAATQFTFFGAALQAATEQKWRHIVRHTKANELIPYDSWEVAGLIRLLLPVMKAQVSVAAVHGLRQCMECLGGVGYCENNEDGGLMNIAKIYRDTLVNPIWEGTVSVMADDVVRVMLDKRIGYGDVIAYIFDPYITRMLGLVKKAFGHEIGIVQRRLYALRTLTKEKSRDELLYSGREILEHIEAIICGVLLMYDATTNPNTVAEEIARRWVHSKALFPHEEDRSAQTWKAAVQLDRQIFLGGPDEGLQGSARL